MATKMPKNERKNGHLSMDEDVTFDLWNENILKEKDQWNDNKIA